MAILVIQNMITNAILDIVDLSGISKQKRTIISTHTQKKNNKISLRTVDHKFRGSNPYHITVPSVSNTLVLDVHNLDLYK